MPSNSSRLFRRLTTTDAVVLGLASMIGAGIFAAAGPAAQVAGSGLLFGVVIAAGLAFLNAASVAQLAALYPESGGTYVYGRKRLNDFWGFLAGWGFIVGKLASCTAMALTFAHYASPDHAKPLAIGSVLLLTLINYLGVKKTMTASKILLALVLSALAVVTFAALAGGAAQPARLSGWLEVGGILGILQSAGMMFFAFAGYARIATLGEEIAEPKTIPRAMAISLSITAVLYLLVMGAAVLCVDAGALATAKAPLALAVESGRFSFFSPVVRIGACLASLGVLLSLLAGISRTVFAMAANHDLPLALSAVHPVHRVPYRAEITVGILIAAVLAVADLRSAIGFSSFAILIYYAIANAAAFTLRGPERNWPRWISAAGLVACLTIAFTLPAASVAGGILLFSCGSIFYWRRKRNLSQNFHAG